MAGPLSSGHADRFVSGARRLSAKGKIVTWNDERGYGFIQPLGGSSQVFVHIKDFAHRGRRPVVGDFVAYSLGKDNRGRPCAKKARRLGAPMPKRRGGASALPDGIAAGILILLGIAVFISVIPSAILILYVAASAVTFAAYATDKSAARRDAWRIPEVNLHGLALIGGWPGALVAQNRLRHKSRKQPFRAFFYLTVVANLAALLWLVSPEGTAVLEALLGSIT